MDLIGSASATSSAGFPRRRGDGPRIRRSWRGDRPFPPQARGWTSGLVWGITGAAVPPQARGWTVRVSGQEQGLPVSPAGAGMDLSVCLRGGRRVRFPRRRGDGPSTTPAETVLAMFPRRRGDGPSPRNRQNRACRFPPQARGWTGRRPLDPSPSLVSPAGAGMDPSSRRARRRFARFPRRRGDGPRSGGGYHRRRRFPRRRGDGPRNAPREPPELPFPPQARGWTPSPDGSERPGAVSPAGAGMDRVPTRHPRRRRCFPCRRGDGPDLARKA